MRIIDVAPALQSHAVSIDIESDETLQPQYDYGKPFRPERIRLVWSRENGSSWKLVDALVSGPRLRKDGTPSDVGPGRNNFARHYSTEGEELRDGAPEWLSWIVDAHRPAQ